MESLQSLEDMRLEFERLEAEESEIDRELGELIKQQPNLLIKGIFLLLERRCFSGAFIGKAKNWVPKL